MKSTKQIAFTRAINLLKASGAVYEVHFEGKVYGGLPKQATRKFKYGRGVVKKYVMPFIQNLEKGASANIPVGKYDLATIQGVTTAWAASMWGAGNYVSHMCKENNHVELLRVN
jgi:hypothetical protein